MEVRREIRLTLAVLVGILLMVTIGSILLFQRMAPAIEQILEENIYSLEAAEQMLASLAVDTPLPARQKRFEEALERAEANITEDRERPVIDTIRGRYEAALHGDVPALETTTAALRALGAVNRDAAVRADSAARRLGSTGAWVLVFLGLLGFAWALLALRRLDARVTEPIVELHQVLVAHRKGEMRRRCHGRDAAAELKTVAGAVNDLLDERTRPVGRDQDAALERRAILHLLEAKPAPALLVAHEGRVLAANTAALERLSGSAGAALRQALREAVQGAKIPDGTLTELGGGAWLVELAASRSEERAADEAE